MSAFPDLIGDGLEIAPALTVITQSMGENHFVRYRKWLRPRYAFALSYSLLEAADARTLADHVMTQGGAAFPFDWFCWMSMHWLWVPVGTATAGQTTFTIPGKETSEHEFFTGSNTPATGFTISAGAGSQGEDRVVFSASVAAGAVLWMNFRGRRRFTVTYETDEQPMPRNADGGFYTFNTRLQQVK
jgi:hypothetical protein